MVEAEKVSIAGYGMWLLPPGITGLLEGLSHVACCAGQETTWLDERFSWLDMI